MKLYVLKKDLNRIVIPLWVATAITVFFLPSQISSQQVIDYDEDLNGGLGESFQPSIKASCTGGHMNIRVDTNIPFEGIIHGPNRTEEGCYAIGKGSRKTYLKLDLTKPPGTPGSCGVKYNKQREEKRVAIAVRAHPKIELLEDRVYIVSCGRAGFQNSLNEVSVVQLKVSCPGTPESKTDTVAEGQPYKLRAEVLKYDPKYDIRVQRCFAFDETDTWWWLVDERGCKDDKLISEFTYDKSSGTAEATIYSMFRLPHSNRTFFQCDVAICKGTCKKVDCSKEKLSLEDEGKLQSSDGRTKDELFETPEDDAVTTSTSVFVAQPGSAASSRAAYCSASSSRLTAADSTWLTWLCIAFGVLFVIMLLINIFLCSAMTCSCTKSEIIEKEPSIYDDYSIYESQYGYANGKVQEFSESDYGSEHGSGQLQHENGGVGGRTEPSEIGTYQSQNYQQSTLGRNRH